MSDIEKQKNKELEEDVNKVVDMTMHNLKLIVNTGAEYYSEVYVSIQGLEEEERERVKAEYKDLFESKINVITP
tara:strand:+ start:804 stop:1025 length:222 start_codon:yes stop_codon:yes gene_type:complete